MTDSDDDGGVNDNFDGIALQHYLFGLYELDMWTFRLEGTYTSAPMSGPWSQGQFAYRLADRSGGAKGAYEVWWDNRSDWNADDEKAVFAGVERRLDDILPVPGFYLGVSGAVGWDGRGWGEPSSSCITRNTATARTRPAGPCTKTASSPSTISKF